MITDLPDGFCTIKARHNGLVLDVRNYGKQSAKVSTCGYVGQTNQQWKITKLSNGFSTIAARHSNLVLDVDDWGGQGSWVSTCGYVKQGNQEWLIEEIVDSSQWLKFPLKDSVDSPLLAEATILCRGHPDGSIVAKFPTKDLETILKKAAEDGGIRLTSPFTYGGGRINFQVELDKDIKVDLAAAFHCKHGKPVQIESFLIRSHISDLGKNIVAGLINADQKARETLLPIVNRKLNESLTASLGNDLLCATVQADGLVVVLSGSGPLAKKAKEQLTIELGKLLAPGKK